MEATFKPSDDILKQLVEARRQEVVGLQQSQAEHLKDLETRGQAQIAALRTLPRDLVTVLDGLEQTHIEAKAATQSRVDSVNLDFSLGH